MQVLDTRLDSVEQRLVLTEQRAAVTESLQRAIEELKEVRCRTGPGLRFSARAWHTACGRVQFLHIRFHWWLETSALAQGGFACLWLALMPAGCIIQFRLQPGWIFPAVKCCEGECTQCHGP